MAARFNPETGQMQLVGTDHKDSNAISARKIYETFSGSDGERLMNDIAQDCINRGQRVPLAIKAVRHVRDKETIEATIALNNVEQMRKVRLYREKMSGRISEAEYQTELLKGAVA